MGEIGLSIEHGTNVTIVSNSFIERFMAEANGAYVKVYLYLLYLVQNKKSFSMVSACDFLGDTEKDVMRALTYWEKAGLLSIKREGKAVTALTLSDPAELEENTEIANFVVANKENPETSAEPQTTFFLAGSCAHRNDEDLKLIISVAEQYLKRNLSPSDYNLICDLFENMSFSSELIFYLFEYCTSNGKTETSYIKQVAMAWANEGVHTVEEAIESSNKYNINYNSVIRAFGLNRRLGKAEMEYIKKWLYSFSMPLEVIVEACNRALLYLGKPDFKYTDGILSRWNEASIRSLEKIKADDAAHLSTKQEARAKSDAAGKVTKAAGSFPQRDYSEEAFKDLEKKLIKNK